MTKKLNCPLCDDGKLKYKYKGVHYWVCEACPFVGFEFYDKKDLEKLNKTLV